MESITPEQIDIIYDLYTELYESEPTAKGLKKIGYLSRDEAVNKIEELEIRKEWKANGADITRSGTKKAIRARLAKRN